MDCGTLAGYNGRLDDVLRRCCPGQAESGAAAAAATQPSLDRFPAGPGATLPSTKRSSRDVSTGIYRHAGGGSPFWGIDVGSDAGRAQVCGFLQSAAALAPADSVT
jgi:hypothetical protein